MKNVNKMILAAALTAASLGVAVASPATSAPTNDYTGAYLSAGLGGFGGAGYTYDDNNKRSFDGGFAGLGATLIGGYRFNRYLAVEADVMPLIDIGGKGAIVGGMVKGMVPVGQRATLFAKAGGGALILKPDPFMGVAFPTTTIGGPMVGAGASYALTQHVDANIQYNGLIITGKDPAILGNATAGLTLHFS